MSARRIPTLSVIVPTHRRPHYLPRAIESAFRAAPDGNVEVIVIPNGPDESWRGIAGQFVHDTRVKWHSVSTSHANVARNHGLRLATGKYVRFLDDDDYFLDDASKQVQALETTGSEICSGHVALTSADGSLIKLLKAPEGRDFIRNTLGPRRRTGLQFYLYRRDALNGFNFLETVPVGQDTHWTHILCRKRDWLSEVVNATVCTWVQHSALQISSRIGPAAHLKLQEQMLWDTITALDESFRLTDARRNAAAAGMWQLIHGGFFLAPSYWARIIEKTKKFFPGTYPDIPLYRSASGRLVDPVILESLMLPKRWLNHGYRQALVASGLKSSWEF
jgi:glycosyltransferase involved in cell wall biosynthesis